MKLKATLLSLSLAALPLLAEAANWFEAAKQPDSIWHVDKSSITLAEENKVKYWMKVLLKTPQYIEVTGPLF